jgi:hypothetical protein
MQNNYKRNRSYRVQLNKSDSESDCEPRTQNKVIKAIKGEINYTRPQTRYINSPLNIQFPISQGSDVPFEISEEYLSDKSYESLSSTDDDNDTDDDILNKIQSDKSNVTKEK